MTLTLSTADGWLPRLADYVGLERGSLSTDPSSHYIVVMPLTLTVLTGTFAVCRLDAEADIPPWALRGQTFSVTRTAEELSVVVQEEYLPAGVRCERGFRALKLHGPFPFTQTGVLVSVLQPLADAAVGIFAISTFDTDYVLVKQEHLGGVRAALLRAGHQVLD